MEIRVLRYFCAIVRAGNISQAARQLHVSQPALSRQLMELEQEIGRPLFIRGHRTIKITAAGQYLYEHAQEIIALVNKTTAGLQAQQVVSGSLDIGAGESPAVGLIMTVIHQLLERYPNLSINLVSGDSVLIKQGIDNGVLDFGIIMGHENLEDYGTLSLPTGNRWGVLMRSDEPLAHHQEIKPTDLIGHSLMTSRQTRQQDTFRHWAGGILDEYHFIGHYNLLYNASKLVETGACMLLTYEGLVTPNEENQLVFRPLEPAVIDENNLIWNPNRSLSPVATVFLTTLKEQLSNQ